MATNTTEQFVATTLMLVTAVVWGYTLGNFCGVIATMNPELIAFRNMYDDLNRFIERQVMAVPCVAPNSHAGSAAHVAE